MRGRLATGLEFYIRNGVRSGNWKTETALNQTFPHGLL